MVHAARCEIGGATRARATSANTGPQEPQGEWVAVEHRDADGNPTLPRELIAGTYRRRFDDVPDGTEIRVHVLAGYKPTALMLVERKIYEIRRMPVRGWRRIGQIAVEMEGWREHEGAWFTAMRGVRLEISTSRSSIAGCARPPSVLASFWRTAACFLIVSATGG